MPRRPGHSAAGRFISPPSGAVLAQAVQDNYSANSETKNGAESGDKHPGGFRTPDVNNDRRKREDYSQNVQPQRGMDP